MWISNTMMHLTSYLNKKNEALIAVHFMHSAVAKQQYLWVSH